MIFKRKPTSPGRSPLPRPQSNVFSYYSNRNRSDEAVGRNLNAQPKIRSVKIDWVNHWPMIVAGVALIVSAFFVLTLNPSPKISVKADSVPNLLRDNNVYAEAAAQLIKMSIWNRLKPTIDSQSISNDLKREFPELANVEVVIPLAARRPVIEITPATPALIVAGQQGTFVVDKHGRAVIEVRRAPSAITQKLPILTDDSGAAHELGSLVLSKESANFVQVVRQQLEAAEVEIDTMTLPALPYELHLRLKGEGYYVKFHTLGDARRQSGAFLAVRDHLRQIKATAREYIDVRVEEKAYYQ